MAKEGEDRSGGGVVLLVCATCGWEHTLEGGESAPEDLACGKCGNQVFRRFDAAAVPDEVQADYLEATERDVSPEDPAGDVTPGDLLDLETL